MAANEERGEFAIELGGISYTMRPSFEAIEAFEALTDKSLLQLAGDAERAALKLGAAAAIVTECVRAWGKATGDVVARGFQIEAVKPLLMEAGIYLVQPQLALMLYMAATGGLTALGEAKSRPAESPIPAGEGSVASPAPPSGGGRKTSGMRRR